MVTPGRRGLRHMALIYFYLRCLSLLLIAFNYVLCGDTSGKDIHNLFDAEHRFSSLCYIITTKTASLN